MGIKEYFQGIKDKWAKNKLLLWALGLAGVLLLVLPGNCKLPESADPIPIANVNYQQQLQGELESILSSIDGVGRVSVMLTLEDEQEVVYARNEEISQRTTSETDSQGGVREQVDYDSRGQLVIVRTNNQDEPVVVKILKPRVRGVLVVAEGGGSPIIRERLTQAVQSVLDVPAYRITVQKGR